MMKQIFSKKTVQIGAAAVGITALGFLGFQYYRVNRELSRLKSDPTRVQQVSAEETKKLIEQVRKLIELPEGEEPTVATVSDVDKLKDQPFFANAQNGDRVLIYTNAKKAILYRPSTNLIIDVAPVNIGQSATPPGQAAGAQTETASVVLRNGTTVVGLTKQYEEQLKKKAPALTVVTRENAKKRDYEKSTLVDVKGTRASEVGELSKTLGISVGNLPNDEATPASDFLIILGEDQIR